jgi:hypothetical protein
MDWRRGLLDGTGFTGFTGAGQQSGPGAEQMLGDVGAV